MKLHEYQSKSLFAKYGIPVPRGRVVSTSSEAKQIAEDLGGRSVIKAQVLIGGRGKVGGIRLARTSKEAEDLATIVLGMEIKGLPVRRVLVDEMVNFTQEIYLAITNDRSARRPVLVASSAGGVEIETTAVEHPEKIIKILINPLLGLRDYQVRDIAVGIELNRSLWRAFGQIADNLWKVYCASDATLAEINPLVVTTDGKLIALDGKMVLDENALFRHPDLVEMRDMDVEASAEIEARKYGLTYIKMDGQIGCMVNGAGLAMATTDIIKLNGGEPANFLDIGGGASADKVAAAFRILLQDPNVKGILINIFGGITRCDEVARGIISAMSEVKVKVPMVVRLVGTNAEQGLQILADAKMMTAETLEDAARKVIELARGGQQ